MIVIEDRLEDTARGAAYDHGLPILTIVGVGPNERDVQES
jgi:hypothetical protein